MQIRSASLVLLACALAAPSTAAGQEPALEFAFEELVTLGPAVTPGATPYGGRVMIPITGGTFAGPGIKGTIVPGGWDWQLGRTDGCTDVHADYMLRTDDGVVINVVNEGVMCEGQPIRTAARFEMPRGKYDWLGRAAFVGTLDVTEGPNKEPAVRIRFYKAV